MTHHLTNLTTTFGFLAFISGIGVSTAVGTDFGRNGIAIWGGLYQRQIETEFAGNMPLSQPAAQLTRAANLALFNQAHPEVVVAGDWLFTAEEFREPSETIDLASELEATSAVLEAAGITLIPVIVPDKSRVLDYLLPARRAPRLEARYDEALALLRREGYPAIDLRALLGAPSIAETAYMRTDTHWSPLGAELSAHEIVTAANLATGSETYDVEVGAPETFSGDLVRFVETGPFSNLVGPSEELIAIPQTQSAGGGDLFGESSIGIVLVGTSFSARPEFNFAGYLQRFSGHDLINLSVEGRGPFAPMREALSSNAILEIRPQYVVWEIPERYLNTWSSQ